MKNIEQLKHFLKTVFPNARIYLFGSRARGDASGYSDIDIAIESRTPIKSQLSHARFVIEESLIPYKVDLVDLSKAPYLKKIIKEEGIVWQ